MTSATTFAVGAALPLAVLLLSPEGALMYAVIASTLIFLAALGALGAKAGGAGMTKATIRVTFWGAVAMAATAAIGALFGAVV